MDSRLQAFHQRLSLSSVGPESACTGMVACVNDSVPANEISPSASISELRSCFFPNIFQLNEDEDYDQVKTPVDASLKYDHSLWLAREELIEIRSNSSLETEFNKRGRTKL